MFNDFIGKKVEITVAFAIGNQASLPVIYEGTLLESNNEFCKISVDSGKAALLSGGYATSKAMGSIFGDMASVDTISEGNMIIRNQYIITILNKEN